METTIDRSETFFELSPAVKDLAQKLYLETKDDAARLRVAPLLSAKATQISEKMLRFILARLTELHVDVPSFDSLTKGLK